MTKEAFARIAFEAHHDAEHGADGDARARWTRLTEPERVPWLAVGALIESCVERAVTGAQEPEDAPGAQAAKVIIVTEADGRERGYDANQWDTAGPWGLRVIRKGTDAAAYAHGAWLSVRHDGAEADDDGERDTARRMDALDDAARLEGRQ